MTRSGGSVKDNVEKDSLLTGPHAALLVFTATGEKEKNVALVIQRYWKSWNLRKKILSSLWFPGWTKKDAEERQREEMCV